VEELNYDELLSEEFLNWLADCWQAVGGNDLPYPGEAFLPRLPPRTVRLSFAALVAACVNGGAMDDAMGLGEEQRSPRRWRWPFTWLGLLALCWVVYELTRQPALGAVAVCLKFGWEDFSAARWLGGANPDRARGRCCSWLYFAWGLWKTAIVAFVMSVAFAAGRPNRLAQAGAADALMAFALTFATL